MGRSQVSLSISGLVCRLGDCLTERFDTVTSVFTKDLGGWPADIVTAHITLTDAQMSAVYRTIEDIRFFDYPPTFKGVPPETAAVIVTIPHNTFRLEVRNAGVVHEVAWTDASRPTAVEADRLRNLISMVRGFIHADPAFKRLPPPHVKPERDQFLTHLRPDMR